MFEIIALPSFLTEKGRQKSDPVNSQQDVTDMSLSAGNSENGKKLGPNAGHRRGAGSKERGQ